MNRKPEKRSNSLIAAVCWTVASAAWIFALIMRLGEGADREALTVITSLTAALSIVNSVINWIRYVTFEEETEE